MPLLLLLLPLLLGDTSRPGSHRNRLIKQPNDSGAACSWVREGREGVAQRRLRPRGIELQAGRSPDLRVGPCCPRGPSHGDNGQDDRVVTERGDEGGLDSRYRRRRLDCWRDEGGRDPA